MDSTDVDCGTCSVRGSACGDCVVSLLLGPPPELSLEPDEQRALGVLADAGLMPPLRLVQPLEHPRPVDDHGAGGHGSWWQGQVGSG